MTKAPSLKRRPLVNSLLRHLLGGGSRGGARAPPGHAPLLETPRRRRHRIEGPGVLCVAAEYRIQGFELASTLVTVNAPLAGRLLSRGPSPFSSRSSWRAGLAGAV